jgi:hypothetical protein
LTNSFEPSGLGDKKLKESELGIRIVAGDFLESGCAIRIKQSNISPVVSKEKRSFTLIELKKTSQIIGRLKQILVNRYFVAPYPRAPELLSRPL